MQLCPVLSLNSYLFHSLNSKLSTLCQTDHFVRRIFAKAFKCSKTSWNPHEIYSISCIVSPSLLLLIHFSALLMFFVYRNSHSISRMVSLVSLLSICSMCISLHLTHHPLSLLITRTTIELLNLSSEVTLFTDLSSLILSMCCRT